MTAPVFARVVVVGAGAVGTLLARLFAPHTSEIVLVDRDPDRGALAWDVEKPLPAAVRSAVADAEAVVLALPDSALDLAVGAVLDLWRTTGTGPRLLIDTASVKSFLQPHWDSAPAGVAFLAVNPMFAADLDPRGRPVLVVEPVPTAATAAAVGVLEAAGLNVSSIADVETHDRLAAVIQAAVHTAVLAFASVASRAGLDGATLAAVAPPPCRTVLRLLARMGELAPEVYDDVQAANPYARETRQALATAIGRLDQAVDDGAGVAPFIDEALDWLGPARAPLARECAAMFSTGLTTPSP